PEQWLTLIAVVDDATKRLLYAELREGGESVAAIMTALRAVLERYGLPMALYTDRAHWGGAHSRLRQRPRSPAAHAGRPRTCPARHRAHPRLFAPSARPERTRQPHSARPPRQRAPCRRYSHRRHRQSLPASALPAGLQPRVRSPA